MNKQFVDNLTNFCDALENIVETLNEQIENNNNVDAILDVLSEIDGNKIKSISENLQEVNERTKVINNRTEEIVEMVRASQEKEASNPFTVISDESAKKKIIEGVSIITLVAGAILLIGASFKLLGDVDIANVIALGISISILTASFKNIVTTEGLTVPKVLAASLMLVAMTTGIVASSYLINLMSPIKPINLIMFGLLGVALSYSFAGLVGAINKLELDNKTVGKILLLPLILPAMAAGIVLSSWMLTLISPVSLQDTVSAALVSIALIPMAFAYSLIAKSVKGLKTQDILTITAVIPLMTLGIAISSYILNEWFVPMDASTAIGFLLTSFAIGIGMIAFLPTIYILAKAKLSPKDMALTMAAIPLIALGISAAAGIFYGANQLMPGLFDAEVPDFAWSLQAGLALIAFLPTFVILAKVLNPGNLIGMGLALVAIPLIALAISITSLIFDNVGDFSNYPSLDWSLGVGLAMTAFGLQMLILGTAISLTGGLALAFMASSLAAIPMIVGAMVVAAKLLDEYDWSNSKYPSPEWANGVGTAIYMFAKAYAIITALEGFNKVLSFFTGQGKSFEAFILGNGEGDKRDGSGIVDILIATGKKFSDNSGVFAGSYPTEEWANGVGKSIALFADAFASITQSSALDSVISFFTGSKKTSFKDFILGSEDDPNGGIVGLIIAVGRRFNEAQDVFESSTNIGNVNYGQIISDFMQNIPNEDKVEEFEDFLDTFDSISHIIRNIDRLSTSLDRLGNSLSKIKANQLQSITDSNSNLFGDIKNNVNISQNNITTTSGGESTGDKQTVKKADRFGTNPLEDVAKYTKNIDENLQAILDMKEKESQPEPSFSNLFTPPENVES